MAEILAWCAHSTLPVSALGTPATARSLLNAATSRLDGKRTAASTSRKHRVILSNAMTYAMEMKLLDRNPVAELKWKLPATSVQVDRNAVVNPEQAFALLEAVRSQPRSGALLYPFFATLYFTGLRPEEAVNLHKKDLTLPAQQATWGEIHLSRAAPDAGRRWTDSGEQRDDRGLKHRAEKDTRTVPCAPELVAVLRNHLDAHGACSNGRVFHGERGEMLATSTIQRVWKRAREDALSTEEYASPLAKRPYDLRHACLSTWLNAGVPAKQVADWAGNSVDVLLSTYAKCLVGQDEISKRRISEVLSREAWARTDGASRRDPVTDET